MHEAAALGGSCDSGAEKPAGKFPRSVPDDEQKGNFEELKGVFMDLNKAEIIGRLTADSAIEYTSGGAAIAKFSIAVDHRKKQDGSAETSFFNCKAFGKLAENLNPYMKKGKQIALSAYLKQERWEKDGQKQSRVILYCDEIQLLGGRDQQNGSESSYDNGYSF